MSMRLSRSGPAGPAFVDLAARLIEMAIARADDFAADPAERIHDVRKRSKRIRALLRMVTADFPESRRVDRKVADAARRLARMRDARVLWSTLDQLHGWAGRSEQLPPEPASEHGQAERVALAEFASTLRALATDIPGWRTRNVTRDTLVRGLAKTYRKARKARVRAERSGDPADFHRWRKQTKYHWCQLDFLRDTAPDILRTEVGAAKELTDILGHHHDLAMLRNTLASDPDALRTPVDMGFVEDAAAARQRELAALAGRLADQVFAEKPKAFARRIAAYRHGPETTATAEKDAE